jgi:FAD/FMN-containing dehydrogenase
MSHATNDRISRRALLRGGLAASVVLGFDPLSQSWVTEARGETAVALPPLDGVLLTDDATLAAYTDDLGHLIHGRPVAVLMPGSVDDIARMVRFAREHELEIAARGQGHTMFGQSLVKAGIVVEMSALNAAPIIEEGVATVRAGVTWRTVLQASLPLRLTPPVLTGYIGLSVGGTLSVGGIGGTTYRYGAQVDQVLELQVVTGEGRVETCSDTLNPDLFAACLAGLGQCGIIVQAALRLVPAATETRVFLLFYPDLETMLDDERQLIADGRFDHVVGYVVPSPDGWVYFIEAASYYTPPAAPDNATLLAGLDFLAPVISDTTYFEFADRVSPQIDALQANGRLDLPHPWFDVFVPDSAIDAYAGPILATLTPDELGPDFPILFIPINTARITRPLLRMPDEPVAFLFDILSTAEDAPAAIGMLARNRVLFERARDLGSKKYVIAAIPFSRHDWQQHYHPLWGHLVSARRHFDPGGVLTPGPGIF